MDGTALGQIVVVLGGGRQREDDQIDHSVGLSEIAPLGTKLRCGQPMALVHCHDTKRAEGAIRAVQAAMALGSTAPILAPLILERIVG
jgi:thymidine phosphorylase